MSVPTRPLASSLLLAALLPFIARLAGALARGWSWAELYFSPQTAILILVSSAAVGLVWFLVGRKWTDRPLAYWISVAGGAFVLIWIHGTLDLRYSSTAGFGLVGAPFLAGATSLAGALAGYSIDRLFAGPKLKDRTSAGTLAVAVVAGLLITVIDGHREEVRLSRFPHLATDILSLEKRTVLPGSRLGDPDHISVDDFDPHPGPELAVLTYDSLLILDMQTFNPIRSISHDREDCPGCVHMYPVVVPDRAEGLVIATSDGLLRPNGRRIQAWDAAGFSRVVPVRDNGNVAFFTYEHNKHVALLDRAGETVWKKEIPASTVGVIKRDAHADQPFALTSTDGSRSVTVFSADGESRFTLTVPEWVSTAISVDWPSANHFLVGNAERFAVIDSTGAETFSHMITDTSFDPYHGPDATTLRLGVGADPHLAVMSHGSSGYDRSVLLLFDATGKLVYKEEMRRLSSVVRVPAVHSSEADSARNDMLLTAGMDGLVAYSR